MTTGSVVSGSGYPQKTARTSKTWTGTDGRYETVDGRKRIRWNNYTMNYSHESAQWSGTPAVNCGSTNGPWGPGVFPPFTSGDNLKLQSKLVQAIKGHDFNMAVNLAQMNKLTSMVVLNVRKLSTSLRLLKRGDFASAARQLGASKRTSRLKADDISGRWLELQYGWLPSIADTYEAAKAYEALTKVRKLTVTAQHRVRGTYNSSASPSLYVAPAKASTSRKIRAELIENINGYRSLGLYDPLSVVWEVIPYSFVIDWFLPIGSYLENLAVIPFLKGRFLTSTFSEMSSAIAYATPSGISAGYRGVGRSYRQVKLERSVSTSLTTARPSFQPLSLALSSRRIFSAIALGHQRLK
jgi:hypothetical protein